MTVSTLYLKHSQGSTPLILRRGPIAYRTNGLWSWCFECFRQEGVSYRRRGRKRTSQNDRNNHENIKKRLSPDLLHSWAIIKTVVQLKLKLIASADSTIHQESNLFFALSDSTPTRMISSPTRSNSWMRWVL